jgi:hypothetical protein
LGRIQFDYDNCHRKTDEIVARTEAFALGKTREYFPILTWSHGEGAFGVNSRYRDLMLEAQLDGITKTLQASTDWVPYIEPWHGVGIYAEAFGCPFEWRSDSAPWTHPIIRNIDQLRAIERPDIAKSDMLQYVLETIRYFDDQTGGELYMASTDTQSPLDTATLILDTDFFFYAAVDYPEELHRLLGYITDLEIDFTRMQRELMSRPITPGHNSWCHPKLPGLGLSEDCMCMVGPDFFDEFARPYNERIAEALGGVAIHSCAVWSQNFEAVRRVRGLVEVDLAVHQDNDPNPNVPEVVRDGLRGSDFIVKVRWPGHAMSLLDRIYAPDLRLMWEVLWDDNAEVRQGCYDAAKRRFEELAGRADPEPLPKR